MALADDGEIFWRDAKLLRKIFYRLMLDFALLQHLQNLSKKSLALVPKVSFGICQQKIAHGKESTLQERLLQYHGDMVSTNCGR